MATETKEKKYNISYEDVIITNMEGLDELPPTFKIENCEVYSSSISSDKSGYSKNIRFLLPDKEFKAIDRKICNYFTEYVQTPTLPNGKENPIYDPNCESFKSYVKEISKKDILDGKFPEHLEGRYNLNIYTTTCVMYGSVKNDEGEIVQKKITKMEQSIDNNIVYKHYSVNDSHSGEPIKPLIYKFINGEKVTTYENSRTKEEKPLYAGANDIVNIVVRPYMKKNEVTGDWYCKYNVLSIEIVQSAFDRGKSNYKKSSTEKKQPLDVSFDGLANMFGNVSQEVPKTEVKKENSASKNKPTTVESKTGIPGKEPEVKEVEVQTTTSKLDFDFNDLFKDMPNTGLGE